MPSESRTVPGRGQGPEAGGQDRAAPTTARSPTAGYVHRDRPGRDADLGRQRLTVGPFSRPTAAVAASPALTARSAASSSAFGQPNQATTLAPASRAT